MEKAEWKHPKTVAFYADEEAMTKMRSWRSCGLFKKYSVREFLDGLHKLAIQVFREGNSMEFDFKDLDEALDKVKETRRQVRMTCKENS